MPFKSKAQMRKFFAMARKGEISMKKVREWVRETKNIARLPEKKAEMHSPKPIEEQLGRVQRYLRSKGVVTSTPPTLRSQSDMKLVSQHQKESPVDGKQSIYR